MRILFRSAFSVALLDCRSAGAVQVEAPAGGQRPPRRNDLDGAEHRRIVKGRRSGGHGQAASPLVSARS